MFKGISVNHIMHLRSDEVKGVFQWRKDTKDAQVTGKHDIVLLIIPFHV